MKNLLLNLFTSKTKDEPFVQTIAKKHIEVPKPAKIKPLTKIITNNRKCTKGRQYIFILDWQDSRGNWHERKVAI
jgi:hypothetical protein